MRLRRNGPLLQTLQEGRESKGVYTLRTLDDALKVRAAAETAKRAVVIGGGFVCVKASEALLRRGLKVSLVEQQQFILSPRAVSALWSNAQEMGEELRE